MTVQAFIKEKFWNELEGLIEEFPEFESLGKYTVYVDGEHHIDAEGDIINIIEQAEDFGYEDEEDFMTQLCEGTGLTEIAIFLSEPSSNTGDKCLELTYTSPSGSKIELDFTLSDDYTQTFYRLEYLLELWAVEVEKPLEQLLKK
jgi:hypothetical protein